MSIVSFGDQTEGKKFKTLDERQVRGASGIMLLLGLIAFVNGFVLQQYLVIPYISGFLALSFLIAVLINPKLSPPMVIAGLLVKRQSPLPIGAVQKRFAWSLGFALSITIFVLSLFLLKDVSYFDPVCMLCIVCLFLLYLETAFGICVGCKIYFLAIRLNLIKAPEEKPNCMGDACETS